jgi:hypothetical protein
MRRFAFAAVLVAIGTVASVGRSEAAGSSTWTLQPTPTPNVTMGGGELLGVSCPSLTDCVAVGEDLAVPLSETWNGAKWTVRAVSVPAGDGPGTLQGVSCPSTSRSGCTAVGSYIDSSGNDATLAERWSNGHWVVQPTPSPGGTASGGPTLLAVDCIKAASCMAVGTYEPVNSGANAPLAEEWNGVSWVVVASASPPGSTWSVLNGVSCSSRIACIAVGYSVDSSGNQFILAEGWDGRQWTILTIPEPAGATQSSLASVSCTSASGCVAVGAATIASTDVQSLAEGWDGNHWTVQPTPSLSAPELYGVSCPAPGECMAVGSYQTSGGNEVTLAEVWNGTAWSVESTPSPIGRTMARLVGAACVSAVSCEAVGFSQDKAADFHTLAEGATT